LRGTRFEERERSAQSRERTEFDTAKCEAREGADMTADAHEETGRITSPMQDFGMREVVIGFVIFLIGAVITFIIPFL
jgi:hypothetical protein